MTLTKAEERRLEALKAALQYYGPGVAQDIYVIQSAEKFDAYLQGKKP